MATVTMLEAKTNLTALVESVADGTETEIIIAREGKPAVKLVRAEPAPTTGQRIGIAKGQFVLPDDID